VSEWSSESPLSSTIPKPFQSSQPVEPPRITPQTSRGKRNRVRLPAARDPPRRQKEDAFFSAPQGQN